MCDRNRRRAAAIGWHRGVLAAILMCASSRVAAVTVIVPTDQPTVQAAVNAAGANGTVIINSNGTFDETVTVTQSVTIHGGVGFTPTIRGTSACNNVTSCTVFFEPNSASPQTLAVSDVRLLPKSGAQGSSPAVVRVLNFGSGDATLILTSFTIENPEGFGYQAVDVRRASCTAGLTHTSVHHGSISIPGMDDAFAGEGGFDMAEGGELNVSDVDLSMSGIAASAFDIAGTPGCGQIVFGLSDSNISVTSTTTSFSAAIANLLLGVTATIERNSFQATSRGDGDVEGILTGGGNGAAYSASITLDANRFFGSGPNLLETVSAAPYINGSVVLTATSNVVHAMGSGFELGQSVGNPAGVVTATLANNTVDGSSFDAVLINAAAGATVSVTMENNLLTNSTDWGIAFSSEAGAFTAISEDFNGFFDNAAGDVEPPLGAGANDVFSDPLYVNRVRTNLRLGIGSPMINAGDNEFATATDADGATRIQDGTVDIGAFEGAFVVTAPTRTASATPTQTAMPSATRTPTRTRTTTPSTTPTPTATSTLTATRTPTATAQHPAPPSATATDSPTATRTRTPSQTQSATSSPSTTPTSSATASAAAATRTITATSLSTVTATPPPVATPPAAHTPTTTRRPCVGDCRGSGAVTIDELVTLVDIALGGAPVTACTAGDENGDGQVSIDELIAAVKGALDGCG